MTRKKKRNNNNNNNNNERQVKRTREHNEGTKNINKVGVRVGSTGAGRNQPFLWWFGLAAELAVGTRGHRQSECEKQRDDSRLDLQSQSMEVSITQYPYQRPRPSRLQNPYRRHLVSGT
jgi:hypothetical protein